VLHAVREAYPETPAARFRGADFAPGACRTIERTCAAFFVRAFGEGSLVVASSV